MNLSPRIFRIAGMVIVILAVMLAQAQSASSQSETPQAFLPLIIRQPTITPTPTVTRTPTPTATPTKTPTITATSTLPPVAWLPVIRKDLPPAPQYVTSYYIQNETGSAVYDLGCALGVRDVTLTGKQDSLVILNFGQMWIENNVQGVGSFTPYWHFIPLTTVEAAVKQYVQGYWNCSGSDTQSQVTLGIGTNNYGGMNTGTTDQNIRRDTMYVFGQKWGEMVTRLNQWAVTSGYAVQVAITGAIDIEWSSVVGWNTPTVTRGWVDGFDSRDNGDTQVYFNFGACVGCPIVPSPTWVYSSSNPWTQDHIWYVSWGARPAYAVPEIYRNDGYLAKQWQAISKFAYLHKGGRVDFSGPMTQWQSCQQRNSTECTRTGGNGLDNTPEEGWQQLYSELNNDPATAQQVLRWVTDIRWQIK